MRPRKNKWDKKKEYFLKVSKKVFLKEGLVSSNMKDIAAKAGVSRTALYYYFKSKKDILREIVKCGLEVYFNDLIHDITLAKSKQDIRQAILKNYFEMIKKDKEFVFIYMQLLVKTNETSLVSIREYFKKQQKEWYQKLNEQIREKKMDISDDEFRLMSIFSNGMVFAYFIGTSFEEIKKLTDQFLAGFNPQ
ncbi:MAG TPA: TetR/AcrR family transcriptional regulator [Candidatus Aminicenantes bacterium]|nr:TetR/AcrR family transcriptional regulator [Candidatus Aminicenantes bacterium]HPB56203.1 TetR/AcrR family transcriptional regulator [Candidatus Aminicenantes bacterium]HPT00089.1 TetR/AcrR family transcriptional regulator [Candidatus Aminicenantes bacterium]